MEDCKILKNGFYNDIVGVRFKGIIAMNHYSPPRFIRSDFLSAMEEMKSYFEKRDTPVYFIGDLNVKHKMFGHHQNDDRGKIIKRYIDEKLLNYLGPPFPTMKSHQQFDDNCRGGRPDIVLENSHR